MEDDKILVQRKNKKIGKALLLILVFLTLITGTAIGVILVKKNQEIREKASTPTGTVRIFISPETKTIQNGQTFDVNILLDTSGNYISALTIVLTYQYSGTQPPIKVENIQIKSDLIANSGWNFPIKTYNASDGLAEIKIGGLNSSTTGYKTTGEEIIATLTLKGYETGSINIMFDPTTTKATNKQTGEDILLTPSSNGNYKVETIQNTTTPSATTSTASTNTPQPTEAPNYTKTKEPIPISTKTPSPMPQPDSGLSAPTLIGIGSGTLLILISMALLYF